MPNDQKETRKLRAILSADVKGYSLLMADDESFTVRTLKEYRNILTMQIEQHDGRVVDSPGDNVLADFASVVDAVTCAVEIQKVLKVKNEDLPDNKKLEFRIGVNIGDVIQDGDRIYGNGVNVAARIEGLADPGGVSISRNAYDHIRDKLNYGYEYLGEHEVKNIKRPVRVYKVLLAPEDAGKLIGKKPPSSSNKWIFLAAVVATMILLLIAWKFYQKEPETTGKPSIAVLPFDNISNDPEQEYISDGMTEELIGDLAKIKGLLVISRNSAFTYKGKSIKVQQIAEELNVRYILEGSVQKSGDKLRIRAQLIEGKTDHHLWSEKYDGELDDFFELQDKITGKIVSALAVKLSPSESDIIASKGTDSVIAHDLYMKGNAYLRRWSPDALVKAIKYFKQAVEMDPAYSQAYVGLAQAYRKNVLGGKSFQDKTGQDFGGSHYLMRHYLELAMKNPTPDAYSILALFEIRRRHYKEALKLAEKAVELAPNSADALINLGLNLVYIDKPKEAIQYIKQAIRLNPLEGNFELGFAYMAMGNYEKAIESAQLSLTDNPQLLHPHIVSAVSYAHLGDEDKAKEEFNKYLKLWYDGYYPDMQFIYFMYCFKNPDVFNRFIEGLVKAGYKKDSRGYYPVDEANKLNGHEIKKLLFGRTINFSISGMDYILVRSKEGAMKLSIPSYKVSFKGKSWIKGDMVCNQYENLFGGVQSCNDVYYNPKGNAIDKSQYLSLSDALLLPFSIED